MGNLFLINDSFELANHREDHRDRIFINFCKAIESAKNDKDCLYATDDIYSRQFSYGTLFFDFFYKSWPELIQNPHLKGISSTSYNLNFSLLYAIPGMVKIIASNADFEQQFINEHKGFAGLEIVPNLIPYICCFDTWQAWKCNWLAKNPHEIIWHADTDIFLPNKLYSDMILLEELKKLQLDSKLRDYDNRIGITFYEEIMKKKGPEIEAYTSEVGRKIAEANYYVYQNELSDNERNAAGGSMRTVFRLLGKDGDFQYLSLDHRHGMFEYHNHHGDHLGEHKFDGSFNSNADPNHNLKTL